MSDHPTCNIIVGVLFNPGDVVGNVGVGHVGPRAVLQAPADQPLEGLGSTRGRCTGQGASRVTLGRRMYLMFKMYISVTAKV